MMNIKNLTVPAILAMSLLFGACAKQKIEAPEGLDSQMQEGIEGIDQDAENDGDAMRNSIDTIDSMEQSTEDADQAVQDGLKNLQKGAENTTDAVKDDIQQGTENTGNAVENLGDELSGDKSE